jgi:hypothetical protein
VRGIVISVIILLSGSAPARARPLGGDGLVNHTNQLAHRGGDCFTIIRAARAPGAKIGVVGKALIAGL